MNEQAGSVEVCQVRSKADLRQFIRFPWEVYRENEQWVPPLIREQKRFLGAENPFFEHAEAEYYLAKREGKVCGRISASSDNNKIDFNE